MPRALRDSYLGQRPTGSPRARSRATPGIPRRPERPPPPCRAGSRDSEVRGGVALRASAGKRPSRRPLERPDERVCLYRPSQRVRVVREAEAGAIAAPIVPEPHEGLLMRADAADLTAAGLGGRWVRRIRYTLLVHSGSPYLWATVPGCANTRGAISFLDALIMRLLYAFVKR
jgi:hypothetical protein